MNCEMCGRKGELMRALVEGIELMVCSSCAGYGKRLQRVSLPIKRPPQTHREIQESVVADYASRIRKASEGLGKTQKEFASMIAEKESIVHHLETGSQEPDIRLARKLEKKLGIKLVEQEEEGAEGMRKAAGRGLTLGDVIKMRKP